MYPNLNEGICYEFKRGKSFEVYQGFEDDSSEAVTRLKGKVKEGLI